MIFRLFVQLFLATSLLSLFPADAAQLESLATLPAAADKPAVAGWTGVHDLFAGALPAARDAAREPVKVEVNSLGVVTSAVSALVVDRSTGKILYEKNSAEPRSIGSIVKLMTALVFLEGDPDLGAPVSLEAQDLRFGAAQHLELNDEVTVRDLLYASLVGSDNSATAALVRLSKISVGDFVARMNEKAAEIGLRSTTFVDPTGLSADNRSVVTDVSALVDFALQNQTIRAATATPATVISSGTGKKYLVESTNELLTTFLNRAPYKIIGGKTGFLPAAGYCFGAVFSEADRHEIIVVVLGSYSKDGRFTDAKALAAWAYKVYDWPDEMGQSVAARQL